MSDFIRTNKKVTVIGLFGREKGYDSNKAIEIFDYLAQRDIFCMRNSDENSDQATIEGFQDVANNRHSDPKFRIPFGKCCGKLRLFSVYAPYARHYNTWFLYFLPHFSVQYLKPKCDNVKIS